MRSAACVCLCAFLLCAAESAKEVFDGAVRALAAGDYQSAERGFQSVLRQEPRNIAALSNLGVIYSRTNRADQAIACLPAGAEVEPGRQGHSPEPGLVYLKQEAPLAGASAVCASGCESIPSTCRPGSCSPFAARTPANWHRRSAIWRHCSAAAPRDDGILFLLGFAYLKNHDAEKAKAIFQRCSESAGAERAQFLLGKANYEATSFPRLRRASGSAPAQSEISRGAPANWERSTSAYGEPTMRSGNWNWR